MCNLRLLLCNLRKFSSYFCLAGSLLVTWLAACWSLGWKPVGHSDDADDNHDDVDADDDADDRFFPPHENNQT